MEIVYISLTAVTTILITVFGIRVYLNDKISRANRFFALFAFMTAFWMWLDFLSYQQSLSNYQTIIYKLIFPTIVFLLVFLLLFINYFPRQLIKINLFGKFLLYVITILLTFLSIFTNTIVDHAFAEDYGFNFIQGNLFMLFVAVGTILFLCILIFTIIKYFRLRDVEKRQIKLILYGITIFLLANAFFNLFGPMITKSFVYGRFGTYSAIFLVGFTAYAILKTHLFNLRIILAESAVVIINVILAVQLFTSHTLTEYLLRLLFLGIVYYGSDLLLGSVKREIKFREELQVLTGQLAHANEHLKELDKMKTEFVSLASHELLTPVSAIEGYLSMLLDEKMARVDDPKAQKYLNNVYISAKRLARLVADMLNISRIEEGRLLVEKKDLDLSKLVKDVVAEIKFKAEERKQKIVFDNPDGWQTYGDQDKIKEIIINILGNAIKYSKNPGTISIHVEKNQTPLVAEKWQKVENEIKTRPLDDQEAIQSAIDPHLRQFVGKEQILISVKDEGIGIPKEELPRLFKKFHRVGDYTTAESQGTGLGLYITRALVELHHGRIWADSEGTDKGSTFTFSLPDISSKDELLKLEAQVPEQKEQLKPLARPVKEAEEL